MSFKPKLDAAQEHAPPREGALAFLSGAEPSPEAAKTDADWAKADRDHQEARRNALRAMNAIKVVGPLLAALMESPGPEATSEESYRSFSSMVESASSYSEKVAKKIGIDPEAPQNFWIRNVLERTFAEIIREQWAKGKGADLSYLDGAIDRLISIDLPHWESQEGLAKGPEDLPIETHIRASLAQAAAPVLMRAQLGFDFFRNMDAELEPIMRRLLASASKATLDLADSACTEADRAHLFGVLIGEAGQLYSNAWKAAGKEAVASLSKLNDAELKEMLKAHPNGLPLDSVNEIFEKNYSRLVSVAAKLVPPQAGKIGERIRESKRKSKATQG